MPDAAASLRPEDAGAAKPAASSTPAGLSNSAHDERRGLLRAAGIMSCMTVLSRVLGLWRDRLMGGIFGASGVNDAFNLAFLLPNLTRRLFGEGALSSVFVPIFSERLATGRREEAFRTASVLLTRLAVGLFAACALIAGACYVLPHVTPLSPQRALTLHLAKVMIFYCVLVNVAAVLMGVLNSLGHFLAGAFAPVLLNLCMILGCTVGLNLLGTAPEERVLVQALAVMAGGVLQLLIMLPPAFARGFRYAPSLDASDSGYVEIRRGFVPVIAGIALFQVNLLLDQLIATLFIPEEGPVTMLAYGNRLIQLPWAIFSLSVATAALPLLARYWAEGRKAEFAGSLSAAVRHTLFLAAPSAVGLCLLSTDLTRLFYGTGAFLRNDGEAVLRTGRVVFYSALGLGFYSLNAVLNRALYATKETRTPTRAAAWAVGANLVLNLVLVLGTDMKEAGLALASTLSGGLQTLLLARALFHLLERPGAARLTSFLGTVVLGTAACGAAAIGLHAHLAANPSIEGFIAFAASAAALIVPSYYLGNWYFESQLKSLRAGSEEEQAQHRFGVSEARWPGDLVFYHAIFTTLLASAVMGLMVWTVRDSLPGEGHEFGLVFQRASVPVAFGVMVFAMAAGGFQSREYEELKAAFATSRTRGGGS